MPTTPYRGVFPVVPTIFHASGELDLAGQRRVLDFMIDAGSQGLCVLANFSEQFALTDQERDTLTDAMLRHVAGRVPVIVTTTHFSTRICAERGRRAQQAGAAMVMVMPPYHGATIRVAEPGVFAFFQAASDAIAIPIMIQDAPVAGTPLSAAFLARMAREIANVSLFQDRDAAGTPPSCATCIALGGDAMRRPLGRRGSHHPARRSRSRRHRRHDGRRLSRRDPPDRRRLRRWPACAKRRAPMHAGCR